jgi:hypothetical protein
MMGVARPGPALIHGAILLEGAAPA